VHGHGQKLSDHLDIHAAQDLVSHHENEIASEPERPPLSATAHNGSDINHEKMSKAWNSSHPRRAQGRPPEVLRFFLLSHTTQPVTTATNRSGRRGRLDRSMLSRIDGCSPPRRATSFLRELSDAERGRTSSAGLFNDFDEAMNDDFNTAEALDTCTGAWPAGAFLHEGWTPSGTLAVLRYAADSCVDWERARILQVDRPPTSPRSARAPDGARSRRAPSSEDRRAARRGKAKD